MKKDEIKEKIKEICSDDITSIELPKLLVDLCMYMANNCKNIKPDRLPKYKAELSVQKEIISNPYIIHKHIISIYEDVKKAIMKHKDSVTNPLC